MTTRAAVAEYFRREKAAMATPQGADHAEIVEQVAHKFGVTTDELSRKIIDQTIARPN